MVPGRCLFLIPGTVKYVTLHGKRDVADGIRLRALRWGYYPTETFNIKTNYKGVGRTEKTNRG